MLIATSKSQTTYTVNLEPPTDDAYIYQGDPNKNFGSSPNLAAGYAGGNEMRMLIKWDLSSLPNNISISNAEIRLYQTTANSSITTDIYRINSVWSEASVTWNNQSSTIGWYGSKTFSSTSGVKYIPATNLVNDWLTNGNNGVMFKINLGTSYENARVENRTDLDKLIIEFENSQEIKLNLLNILGQEIYNQKISGDNTEISLSEFSDGIYFLIVETEKGIFRKKIFIVR